MGFKKKFVNLVSVLLIGLLLNHCAVYREVAVPQDQSFSYEGRALKLIWEDSDIQDMYMVETSMVDNKLIGLVISGRFYTPPAKSQKVDIYIDPSIVPPDSLPTQFSFPVSAIKKIELFELDVEESVGITVLNTGFAVVMVFAVIFAIILLTKESCPFIYVHDGESYQFTGEIYSGAIYPHLERDDFLPLPQLKHPEDEYHLKMTNEVREIQYTNLTELLVIDHPDDTDVLVDKYGTCYTLKDLQTPKTAISSNRQNILPQIVKRDSQKYLGDSFEDPDPTMDSIVLSFDNTQKMDSAKLVVRAKNSFWLDYVFAQFFELFGDNYDKWLEKQKNLKEGKQKNWSLEQGIPLSVYLEKNGDWQFIDYYNVVGPIIEKDIVLSLDISDIDSEEIKIKLEFGFLFWEIDFVGMDFSPQQPVEQNVVSLTSAVDHNGLDVTELLVQSDDNYFIMPAIGDQVILKFAVPKKVMNDQNRSIFLHSRGHYEVIRNPEGRADVSYLRSFRHPGKFSQFSKEIYLELERKIKNQVW
ncbi:MAG: hypothetical protein KAS53_06675 [Candidatus Cloacimonetes bacterium]|nr:hypothetical protein [Candidatus Cloacimonadota bacterium]